MASLDTTILLTALAITVAGSAAAKPKPKSDFDGLACDGSDLAAAMKGRHRTNGPVSAQERTYSALGLKDLGAEMYDDRVAVIVWRICGKWLALIEDDAVRDALQSESELAPVDCVRGGKKTSEYFGILRKGAKDGEDNMERAWLVDRKTWTFVAASTAGLRCAAL